MNTVGNNASLTQLLHIKIIAFSKT